MASLWNTVYFNDSEIIAYLNDTIDEWATRGTEFLTIDAAIDNDLHLRAIHDGKCVSLIARVASPGAPGVMVVSEFLPADVKAPGQGEWTARPIGHLDPVFPALVTSEERLYNSLGYAEDGLQSQVVDGLYDLWTGRIPYPGTVSIARFTGQGDRLSMSEVAPLAKSERTASARSKP
jgi:hypothetical protein